MAGWRIESLGEEASGLHGDEPGALVLVLRGVAGAARLEVHEGGDGGGGPVELGRGLVVGYHDVPHRHGVRVLLPLPVTPRVLIYISRVRVSINTGSTFKFFSLWLFASLTVFKFMR